MTDSKQKAIELVASFKDFVNPYMGSSMLSNTYDNDAILFQAKKCAHVCVNQIIKSNPSSPYLGDNPQSTIGRIDAVVSFYGNVRNNIDLVTVEDIFNSN
jgi:hypothetical protein